jgi:hypothetical protein
VPSSASMILLVLAGAERGDDQRLRFAAGEQRRAVGARQDADFGETIGRTVLVSRPSMRLPVSRMFQRTMSASSSLKFSPTTCSDGAASLGAFAERALALTLALAAATAA